MDRCVEAARDHFGLEKFMLLSRALVEEGGIDPNERTTKTRLVRSLLHHRTCIFKANAVFAFICHSWCCVCLNGKRRRSTGGRMGKRLPCRFSMQTPLDMLSATKAANPELIAYVKSQQGNPVRREGPCCQRLTDEDMRVRYLT